MTLIFNTKCTSAAAFTGSSGDRRLKLGGEVDPVDIACSDKGLGESGE